MVPNTLQNNKQKITQHHARYKNCTSNSRTPRSLFSWPKTLSRLSLELDSLGMSALNYPPTQSTFLLQPWRSHRILLLTPACAFPTGAADTLSWASSGLYLAPKYRSDKCLYLDGESISSTGGWTLDLIGTLCTYWSRILHQHGPDLKECYEVLTFVPQHRDGYGRKDDKDDSAQYISLFVSCLQQMKGILPLPDE